MNRALEEQRNLLRENTKEGKISRQMRSEARDIRQRIAERPGGRLRRFIRGRTAEDRRIRNQVGSSALIGGAFPLLFGQGIGGALTEHMQFDELGQPVTSSFADYLMPVSSMVPDIRLDEVICPSPTNQLGVKGLGEGGAVGPPAALANAVEDALGSDAPVIRSGPLTPSRVRDLIRES